MDLVAFEAKISYKFDCPHFVSDSNWIDESSHLSFKFSNNKNYDERRTLREREQQVRKLCPETQWSGEHATN